MINPNNIKWVQNTRTKPLDDELDVIAVKRKCDYPDEGTIVKLTHIKSELPHAEIRFRSGVKSLLRHKYAEGLCYIYGHIYGEYKEDANGDWAFVKDKNQPHANDAYQHSITNTYGMTCEVLIELAETMLYIKKVLIERILQKV